MEEQYLHSQHNLHRHLF